MEYVSLIIDYQEEAEKDKIYLLNTGLKRERYITINKQAKKG